MKAAIFDMDGTLLDSMYIWDNIGFSYLREKGIEPPPDLYERLKPLSLEQCVQYFSRELGIKSAPEEMIDEINRLVQDEYIFKAPLKPGVPEFLEKLRRRGIALCVATATAHYQSEAALKRLGIYDYFSFILTCSEVGAGKDDPRIFELALQKLGVPKSEAVVFEDALHAVQTAKAAGFRVVALREKSAAADENQIRALADVFIDSFLECEVEDL